MIKHTLKDELIYLSIEKKDFSHRIPLEKIGKIIQWNIGKKVTDKIMIRNVSKWTLRLFTQNITEIKYVEQFQSIVQHYAPKNNIDWKATRLAIIIQNEFNSRLAAQKNAETRMTEEEIIAVLEEKYGLD